MTILSRVNDSKDGQIQSKLERSVCVIGLRFLALAVLTGLFWTAATRGHP